MEMAWLEERHSQNESFKVTVNNSEKDCRICSNNFEAYSQKSCVPIVLGCSCNGDLAFAHQKCAEKWFKIKGDKNCEICGSAVKNLVGFENTESTESSIRTDNNAAATTETQKHCHGHILIFSILGGILLIIVLCYWIKDQLKLFTGYAHVNR